MPCGGGSRVSCSLAPAAAVSQPEYNFKLACAPELRPSWELYSLIIIDYAARSAFEAKESARRGDSTAEVENHHAPGAVSQVAKVRLVRPPRGLCCVPRLAVA